MQTIFSFVELGLNLPIPQIGATPGL